MSFGRCSLLFPSPTLLYSSCRAVGSAAHFSAGSVHPGNSIASITMAPFHARPFEHRGVFRSFGAGSIHHPCSTHRHVSNRRKVSYAILSGAAASHAFSRKARSRVHEQCNAPHPGPEGLCNKNRFGTDPVRARCRSARRLMPHQRKDKRLGDNGFRRSE